MGIVDSIKEIQNKVVDAVVSSNNDDETSSNSAAPVKKKKPLTGVDLIIDNLKKYIEENKNIIHRQGTGEKETFNLRKTFLSRLTDKSFVIKDEILELQAFIDANVVTIRSEGNTARLLYGLREKFLASLKAIK